jgi:GNAT superfamily N-acetyltransferase
VERVFAGLSERSRRHRFLAAKPRLPQRELEYLSDVGRCGHEALVAATLPAGRPVGIARYVRSTCDDETAEVAVEVIDEYQGRGVGRLLGRQLVRHALAVGVTRFRATVSAENTAGLRLVERLGTVEEMHWEGPALELTVRLH